MSSTTNCRHLILSLAPPHQPPPLVYGRHPSTDVSGGNDLSDGLNVDSAQDCLERCAKSCACSVAVFVAGLNKCYPKHPPATIDPVGKGGAIHTAITCTVTCPPSPGPSPGPPPPGPPPPTGTLWKASLAGMAAIDDVTALFIDGQRGVRARCPDANPVKLPAAALVPNVMGSCGAIAGDDTSNNSWL